MEINLLYESLSKSEIEAAGSIFYGIVTNPRIMETIDDFHLIGIRCAAIVVQKDGTIEEVLVREQHSVTKNFPFDEITGTLANYDIEKQVCIVLVRDGNVCSVLVDRAKA